MSEALIYKKMAQVLADTMPVDKNGYNEQQRFKFRSIDDTVANVRKALIKHGVAVLPEILHVEKSTYVTGKGSVMNVADVQVAYNFVAEDGSMVPTSMAGQAADSGDKAVSKALSMAFKYALFQTFLCGTDGDPDSEIAPEAVMADTNPNALTKEDGMRLVALAKDAGVDKTALPGICGEALGRPIASSADLIKADLPEVEAYLNEMIQAGKA